MLKRYFKNGTMVPLKRLQGILGRHCFNACLMFDFKLLKTLCADATLQPEPEVADTDIEEVSRSDSEDIEIEDAPSKAESIEPSETSEPSELSQPSQPATKKRRTSTSSTATRTSSNRSYAMKKWESNVKFQLADFGKVFEVTEGEKGTGMPLFVVATRISNFNADINALIFFCR